MKLSPASRIIKENWILALVVLVGGFFRFFNLNWDQGYFFNPDESNNIAIPAANLKPPFKPEQFAYGSLTIYLYRLVAILISYLTGSKLWLNAEYINIVGRIISAFISCSLIILVFYLGKKTFSKRVGLLAAFFTSLNVGLIQAAHFGTTETILALGGVLILIVSILVLRKKQFLGGYLLGGVTLGLTCGAKVSALVFFPPFLFSHLLSLSKKDILRRNALFFLSCVLIIFSFLAVFPYSLLDFKTFRDSFQFQQDVATGKIPVFFTGQFYGTTPYLFQITRIFPWILGWPLVVLGFLGLGLVAFKSLKTFSKEKIALVFLPAFYFLYNGPLFVKWTRYMIPLVPFLCLFASIFLLELLEKSNRRLRFLVRMAIVVVVGFQFFYALAFFSIYCRRDSRVTASHWIYQNIPLGTSLLLEPLDVVSLPLPLKNYNPSLYKQVWFDFYSLDDHSSLTERLSLIDELSADLTDADYFIIGSRRIYINRLRLEGKFPIGARYYTLLFNGQLGFVKIKEVNSYPKFLGIELNDDSAEETFQVFDHPNILIFKNVSRFSADYFKRVLLSENDY